MSLARDNDRGPRQQRYRCRHPSEEIEMASRPNDSRAVPAAGRTVADAQPHWDPPPHPGPDAPDVVYIVLDDLGFAQLGCYGASIETPSIDALAQHGIRYTNFHVTAMCSPTRTC